MANGPSRTPGRGSDGSLSRLEARGSSGVPTPSGIRIRMRRRRLPRPTFDVFDIRNGGAEVSTRARHASSAWAWANVYLRIAGRRVRPSSVLTSRARGHSHAATPTRRAESRSVTNAHAHAPRRSLSRTIRTSRYADIRIVSTVRSVYIRRPTLSTRREPIRRRGRAWS